jgi:1-acyl-sn-glycerol-3-phosphate acyltransferase
LKNLFSISLVMPKMAKWKVNLIDFILNLMPLLQIGRANRIGRKYKHLDKVAFGEAAIKDIGLQVELIGKEYLPQVGAVTIVANHPGGADVLATVIALGRERPDTVILANQLICIDPVKTMVIPVDTMSNQKVDMTAVHQAYRDGKVVVFYAAGKNSRYNKEELLRDRRWRITFLELAKQYNTPVNVLKIEGSNSPLFYKVSKFRENNKWLKNVPLENFFQLREIMETKGLLKLFVSKPIYFDDPTKTEIKSELRVKADRLYDFIYAMNDDNLEFEQYEASTKSNASNG